MSIFTPKLVDQDGKDIPDEWFLEYVERFVTVTVDNPLTVALGESGAVRDLCSEKNRSSFASILNDTYRIMVLGGNSSPEYFVFVAAIPKKAGGITVKRSKRWPIYNGKRGMFNICY